MATPDTLEGTGLRLDDVERAILADEIPAFAGTLHEPAARQRYDQLAAAVARATVPAELVPSLETMLELLLQTQRVRRQHGVEAEQALQRLLQRSPRGAALKSAAREVNDALTALRGHVVEKVAFTPTPRGHTLVIDTETCHLTLSIERAGVHVDRMEVGG